MSGPRMNNSECPNSLYPCQLLQAQVPHPHVSVRLPEGGIGCESAAIAVGETLSFSHIFSVSVSAQHHIICCTSWLSHVRRMINVFDNCGRLCKVSPPAVNGYVSPPTVGELESRVNNVCSLFHTICHKSIKPALGTA